MKILYGISVNNSIDVTEICQVLRTDNIIHIPAIDYNRADLFTDPYIGFIKKIFIIDNESVREFDHKTRIEINTSDNTIYSFRYDDPIIEAKISEIQSKLKLSFGIFSDELPEQKMVVRSLSGNEKVLEIGSNIGRNSLVIASILQNQNNFVTLESDKNSVTCVTHNRDLNNFKFHIENSALSTRKLIQRGWNTIPSDILLDGYNWVDTINFVDLQNKYKIEFDTLVLDCEGAFYYILMDMPEILSNVNLIIMENDYLDINHKQYVDKVLIRNNFFRSYVESGEFNLPKHLPCRTNFYEIWKKYGIK